MEKTKQDKLKELQRLMDAFVNKTNKATLILDNVKKKET